MIQVGIKVEGWDDEVIEAEILPRRLNESSKVAVKATSLQTMRRVKETTPIDTGRARASWGSDIWIESDGGKTIEQGSNVPYFQRLNEGWSKQAPAGFVEIAVEQAIDDIEQMFMNEAGKYL